MRHLLAAIAMSGLVAEAAAGEAQIVDATASWSGGSWRFDVTVQHGDTGWDHYADAWRVVGPDGTIYGTRTLHHPHVNEQPFTRSLSGVSIPNGVTEVLIQGRDSVHGWSEQTRRVRLSR